MKKLSYSQLFQEILTLHNGKVLNLWIQDGQPAINSNTQFISSKSHGLGTKGSINQKHTEMMSLLWRLPNAVIPEIKVRNGSPTFIRIPTKI